MTHPIARHGRLKTPGRAALVARALGIGALVVAVSAVGTTGLAAWSVASEVHTVALVGEETGLAATLNDASQFGKDLYPETVTDAAPASSSDAAAAPSPLQPSDPQSGDFRSGATAAPEASGATAAPTTPGAPAPDNSDGTGTGTGTPADGAASAAPDWQSLSATSTPTPSTPTPGAKQSTTPTVAPLDGGLNLLIAGSDSRDKQGDAYGHSEGNLNDVTMLLHISSDHSSATVVSFPRDLVVPVPSCPNPAGGSFDAMSAQPINVTLSYGGLPCTVLTVEELTGLSIPYAAQIQFNGIVEMSNAVGGVPVCVAEPIDDPFTGVTLEPGTHLLEGADALGFLRTRHGVGDGSDLSRISSQQLFLASLLRTMKSSDTLGDPAKLFGIARAASGNTVLSKSLASPDTLVSIALALRDVDLDDISLVTYPGATGGEGDYAGKVQPLVDDAEVLFRALRADRPVELASPDNTGLATVTRTPGTPSTPESGVPTSAPDAATAPVALPESITGQTAAASTCSKGNDD